MFFRREDRRELAQLGLMILGVGVVFAPVLHNAVEHGIVGSSHTQHVHDHGHPHDHGHDHPDGPSGPTHRHGDHDLTHLGAIALAQAPMLQPPAFAGIELERALPSPRRPERPRWRTPSMPQGP